MGHGPNCYGRLLWNSMDLFFLFVPPPLHVFSFSVFYLPFVGPRPPDLNNDGDCDDCRWSELQVWWLEIGRQAVQGLRSAWVWGLRFVGNWWCVFWLGRVWVIKVLVTEIFDLAAVIGINGGYGVWRLWPLGFMNGFSVSRTGFKLQFTLLYGFSTSRMGLELRFALVYGFSTSRTGVELGFRWFTAERWWFRW